MSINLQKIDWFNGRPYATMKFRFNVIVPILCYSLRMMNILWWNYEIMGLSKWYNFNQFPLECTNAPSLSASIYCNLKITIVKTLVDTSSDKPWRICFRLRHGNFPTKHLIKIQMKRLIRHSFPLTSGAQNTFLLCVNDNIELQCLSVNADMLIFFSRIWRPCSVSLNYLIKTIFERFFYIN